MTSSSSSSCLVCAPQLKWQGKVRTDSESGWVLSRAELDAVSQKGSLYDCVSVCQTFISILSLHEDQAQGWLTGLLVYWPVCCSWLLDEMETELVMWPAFSSSIPFCSEESRPCWKLSKSSWLLLQRVNSPYTLPGIHSFPAIDYVGRLVYLSFSTSYLWQGSVSFTQFHWGAVIHCSAFQVRPCSVLFCSVVQLRMDHPLPRPSKRSMMWRSEKEIWNVILWSGSVMSQSAAHLNPVSSVTVLCFCCVSTVQTFSFRFFLSLKVPL